MASEVFLKDKLYSMLHQRWRNGAIRHDGDTNALVDALRYMEKYKQRASVTDRNIAVLSYLARNPSAIIVPDVYTTGAFKAAIRSIECAEYDEYKRKMNANWIRGD